MRSRNTVKVRVLNIVTCLVLTLSTLAVADEQEDLAKESQNPIGNIISLPLENNFDFGVGPEDALVYKLNLKPVYPFDFKKVNLINRFILPVIYQEERTEGEGSEFGLGDFTYLAFFSPPFGGGIGRLIKVGKQPVDLKLQGFYNVENPKGTADWSLQFQVKLLFPK